LIASIFVDRKHNPTLSLVYLPHLTNAFSELHYDRSRPKRYDELDEVLRRAVRPLFIVQARRIILLSEYGIAPVPRPCIECVLRENGLLSDASSADAELWMLARASPSR